MMCKSVCRLCNRLVISQAVTYSGGTLVVNLPDGSYNDGEKYCLVIAQSIPQTATIGAPVVVTIGTGTTLYPLNKCNCAQATVCNIRSRTRYAVCVATTPTGGSFRLLGNVCCAPTSNLRSLSGAAPAAAAASASKAGG